MADTKTKKKSYLMYYIIGVIVLVLIIVYFSFFRLNININTNKILRCDDGTIYESCSISKPLFCSNGSLIESPIKCGCSNELVLAGNDCKNASDLLPDSNYTCKELVRPDLSVRFGYSGNPSELVDIYNTLINNQKLNNVVGKYCNNHLPAKAGENINVNNLFYCYGFSNGGGDVDSNGIVKKSYKIYYNFEFDKNNCANLSSSVSGSIEKCKVNSVSCSWNYTN